MASQNGDPRKTLIRGHLAAKKWFAALSEHGLTINGQ
jgi:hypothetical protein